MTIALTIIALFAVAFMIAKCSQRKPLKKITIGVDFIDKTDSFVIVKTDCGERKPFKLADGKTFRTRTEAEDYARQIVENYCGIFELEK